MKQFALLAALLMSAVLFAQEPASPPAEKAEPAKAKDKPVLSPEELAAKQREVGKRLKKIHDTMNRIADIMAKTDPEKAARLREAYQRSLDDQNIEKITEIEHLLKEEYFNPAAEAQKDLEQRLERLLDILLDRDAERNDLQDKIEKYEAIAKTLDDLIKEEKDHKAKTDKFANPEKTLQKAKAAMAKLENLINRQNKLKQKTESGFDGKDADALRARVDELRKKQASQRGKTDAATQEALAKEAAQLAKDIKAFADALPAEVKQAGPGGGNPADQAAKATGRAAAGMADAAAQMKGGGEFQGQQGDAESDLKEASEALKRLKERQRKHDEKNLEKDQERLKKDAARLQDDLERLQRSAPGADSGGEDVGKAKGEMGKSGGKLSKGKRADSVPHQDEAIKDLKNAFDKLKEFEKELKRLIKLPEYEKLAKEQDDTAEKTKKLADKMKKAGPQGESGKEGEGAPGTGGAEGAKKAMDRASRNLRGKSSGDANRDQQEAIDRLEKAREELEEALRQMREEEQLMLLDAIERRLIRMLQQQRKIFKDTLALHDRVKDIQKNNAKPARADVDLGHQLGDGEGELAFEADKLLELLKEEGSTVVIPDVVDDMKSDLTTLKTRLHKLLAGQYTQQIQQDVIATLKEIIEVIQEERNRRQGGQGQGGEGQEGESPQNLLPTSAELKMLKALQVRVNRRTSRFDRLREKEDDERVHIAGKQKSVGTLTRTMADKLNKEEE